MNSAELPEAGPGQVPWTARLWVRLTAINLLAIAAVVVTLTAFVVYRATTVLAALPPSRFLDVQRELRLGLWQGMAELLHVVAREVLLTALLGTALALGVAWLLSAVLSRSVNRLARAISQLAAGDFQVRVQPSRGPHELTILERGLNRTAGHLEHLEHERRFESAAIAHELRTPITALRLRVAGLQDGIYVLEPGELEPMHRQLEHLEALAEALQTLTLADAGRLTLHCEKVEVRAVMQRLLTTFRAQADRRSVSLTVSEEVPMHVHADAFRLHQALGNLVQNAVNHTPAGGTVLVETTVRGAFLRFAVSDSGPGVPDAALQRLFERFYRADESRARHSGGSGLGLAIVEVIAEAHGGHVHAARASLGGLRIEMDLPLNPPDFP